VVQLVLKGPAVTITIAINPQSPTDLNEARRFLNALSSLDYAPDGAPQSSSAVERAGSVKQAVDDLWSRLGARGRRLVAECSEFEGQFTLPDLAKRTGDDIPTIKSRWANLGRSLRKTHSLYAPVRIYEEHLPAPNGDGYFPFSMPTAVREIVRSKNV
jgi:hypothetical protein